VRKFSRALSVGAIAALLGATPLQAASAAVPAKAGGSSHTQAQTEAGVPSKNARGPIMFYNVPTTAVINGERREAIRPAIQPPPILLCLPVTPPSPVPGCVPPAPPAGEPWPGNMAYFGGHVQVNPKIYLVYWGWDTKGAFNSACTSPAGDPVTCDPDGAGKRMYDFVQQMGGTQWAGVSTQYYQTNPDGSQTFVTNPANQLGGVWVDDSSHLTWNSGDSGTTLQNEVFHSLAAEASAAVAHFGLTSADLLNANIVILQPQNYSDPVAQNLGYCAWHDYTEPGIEGGIYDGLTYNVSFTNMPYVLDQGASCGENAINSGAAGTLDGFTIVLGHEIQETVTDPGAEDPGPNGTNLGAWYDNEAYEIGDKCAWVGDNLTGVGPEPLPIPGAMGTMTGNQGEVFPVQSLWSNGAAEGAGYCAGAGTDLPAGNTAPGGGTVPEAPIAVLVPALGLALAGGALLRRRSRRPAPLG
jgi:hypothetical protein